MGNFNRDDRSGGSRGGYQSRGRSSFGRGGRSFDRSGDRPMFKTICSNCGKECEVPFRPTNGKPVYCSDCFEKMGPRREDSGRPQRSDFRAPAPSFDQNKAQFDALNAKLERILGLLEPKVAAPLEEKIVPASVKDSGEAKEVKAPKAKKVKSL